MWGVRICRPYLDRKMFRVHSDLQALCWLFAVSMNDDNPRLVRWRLAHSEYDLEVVYKPGPQQRFADELSRMVTEEYAPPSDEDGEGMIPSLVLEV